jgi:hypothetical protein
MHPQASALPKGWDEFTIGVKLRARSRAEEPLGCDCVLEKHRDFGNLVHRIEPEKHDESPRIERRVCVSMDTNQCCHVMVANQPVLPLEGVEPLDLRPYALSGQGAVRLHGHCHPSSDH